MTISSKPDSATAPEIVASYTASRHQPAWFSHILLVDGSGVSRAHAESALTEVAQAGQFVFIDVALDASSAMELASDTAYDLVIIDAHLAGAQALSLCRQLKQLETPPHILVLDESLSRARVREGKLAGCDNYLAKPAHASDLQSLLRLLALRKQRAHLG